MLGLLCVRAARCNGRTPRRACSNSVADNELFLITNLSSFSFFSQRTRLACGMTHNVCVNNATPTRRYQHSMSPGAEGLSEHFTFGLAAISRPPMQMCERRCLRCYAFVPRDVIHAHSAGCTDRLSKATDPLSSHSLQKLLLFCSPTWTRGMTHNVCGNNAAVFVNSTIGAEGRYRIQFPRPQALAT